MTSQVRHHVCLAASALALLAGTAAASAQTTVITREPVETRTVVTTERAPLQLSPQPTRPWSVVSFTITSLRPPRFTRALLSACR